MNTDYKLYFQEILLEIYEQLCDVREGVLDDSSKARGSYQLGYLMHFVKSEFERLQELDEEDV